MIESFREGEKSSLARFYRDRVRSKSIPATIERQLGRKLDLLEAASSEQSLYAVPSNHYERLVGKLNGWSSIRVNIKWRLLFRWIEGVAYDVYLDPHTYRG